MNKASEKADLLFLAASREARQAQTERDPTLAPIWQAKSETYAQMSDAAHARAEYLRGRLRAHSCG